MSSDHVNFNESAGKDFKLWRGGSMPLSRDMPLLEGVSFHVIKPWEFDKDGYRFLHGVALAWHNGRLYASFGHNKGAENTSTEEARGRVSDDGGKTWGEVFTINSGEEENLAVSHGVFLSHEGRLRAFHGAYCGTMERVHTRSYLLNEDNGQWERKGVIVEGGFWPMQEPQKMGDGNWIMAGVSVGGDCSAGGTHPAAVAISHGDNMTAWDLVVIPIRAPGRVWGESTVFLDGPNVTNIARYGEEAKALAAFSNDYGRRWTDSRTSNLPMITSKPYAGTLSTGQHYL
ncbi:MAG: exo-alpha-sialidase, partial [Victivallales bacterium]